MENSLVNIQYVHSNYNFKVPIYCYTHAESSTGLLLTLGTFGAINGAAYYLLQRQKASKDKYKNPKYVVAYAHFQTQLDGANKYLRSQELFLNKSVNDENNKRGLIIIEAYFGLAEHIVHIEAELM